MSVLSSAILEEVTESLREVQALRRAKTIFLANGARELDLNTESVIFSDDDVMFWSDDSIVEW